jgi:tight adherence protein C
MFLNSAIPVWLILTLVGAVFLLVAGMGILLLIDFERNNQLSRRLAVVTEGLDPHEEIETKNEGPLALRLISGFGMIVVRSGMLSRKTLAEITATLEGIGFRGGRGIGLFIGSKILLTLLGPVLGFLLARHLGLSHFWLLVCTAGGLVVGMLSPEWIATKIRQSHLEKVSLGVPDALDMLVICADAGLALEAGIARVSQELEMLNPNLALELSQTSRELTIGSDMRQAMDALGERTGLETLKRLATTLAQSLQYGTPLTQALRTLSAELRAEALVRFEERAGRLPTLMTMPMILFILPCVFLVLGGPAMINVMAAFHHH